MPTIVTIGIDLAKNVFAVHCADATDKPALVRPSVPRAKLLELIASLLPCMIGMEACSGAHHWAHEFQRFGHMVRLMAPKFVIPYRLSGKRGKNDAADAAAICEAITRPSMRFVPIKSVEQQGPQRWSLSPFAFREIWGRLRSEVSSPCWAPKRRSLSPHTGRRSIHY